MNASRQKESPKRVKIRDGTEIRIRPLVMEDLDRICEFFGQLPEEDRNYLRFDVTDRRVVEERLQSIQKWGRLKRLIALDGERIVGTGVLELHDRETGEAEIRLIVARDFQRRGLGTLLSRELYFLAIKEGVEVLMISYLAPNKGARQITRRLGFHLEEVNPSGGRDLAGHTEDLIVARCPIQEIFEEMEHYIDDFDWQRSR